MSLSNVSLVAFHYRPYGTFFLYSKKLHNFHGVFTHYRNYRAEIEEYPPFWRQLGHLFLQVITVGMGAPVGKEVAPRELGSLFSTHLVKKIPLDSDQRSVLVASSAAAGLAAIYQIPFASLIFVFEVLGIPLTAINVVVAFITTYGATAIAHLRISDAPLYHVNPQPVTWVTFVVTVILTFATIP